MRIIAKMRRRFGPFMRKTTLNSLCLLAVLVAGAVVEPVVAHAQTAAFTVKAKQAYVIDAETGTVLLSQNEEEVFPPASLSKLMTVDLVLDQVVKGELSPTQTYAVSEYAWRTGGAPSRTSTMFAALKSNIPVKDLLTGVIVQNANDACIILAEGMTGSDANFAKRMTERGVELGLEHSVFTNSTGLPDPGNKTTVKDMVVLAQHLHQTYPAFYSLFSKPDFEWNKIYQRNKNTVLSATPGIDGLGLGFDQANGFAVVASAERDGRRIYLGMAGLPDDKVRFEETRRVVEWGLTSFQKRTLYTKGETVGAVSVYGGTQSSIDVAVAEPVNIVVPISNPDRLTGNIVYHWPLNAPVEPGFTVGTLQIFAGDRLLREVPLVTTASVEKGTLSQNAGDALMELLFFWL